MMFETGTEKTGPGPRPRTIPIPIPIPSVTGAPA
jgi:hypothetical protein